MTGPRPPRILRALLARLLPASERRHLMGEMDDLFASRERRYGRLRASLWHLRQSMRFPLSIGREGLAGLLASPFGPFRDVLRDLTYAARGLRRRPSYTLATALTLAVGIGGVGTVYAVANWVLLRPVAGVAAPESLVTVQMEIDGSGALAFPLSHLDLASLRSGTGALEALEATTEADVHVEADASGPPLRSVAEVVTDGFFDLLGLSPARGRLFLPGESDVTLVSAHFARRLGHTPAQIVGTTVRVNGHPFVVIGVLPEGFRGAELPGQTDLWFSASALPAVRTGFPLDGLNRRERTVWRDMVGRLRPGTTTDQLAEEAAAVIESVRAEHGWDHSFRANFGLHGYPGIGLSPRVRNSVRRTLGLLAGVASLLLLLASANLTNLGIAHSATLRDRLAVHAALGAGRGRLARRMLSEHLLLGLLGAAMGVGVVTLGLRLFADASLSTEGAALSGVRLDLRVLLFTVGAAVLAGVGTGVFPALRSLGRNGLIAGLYGVSSGRRRTHRVQSGLVVVQVGISAVLLVVAGLLTRTVLELRTLPLGFEPGSAMRFVIDPRVQGHDEPRVDAILRSVQDALARSPSVAAAGFASPSPVQTSYLTFGIRRRAGVDEDPVIGGQFEVTEGFLEAFGVTVLAGRTLRPEDRFLRGEHAPFPVVVTRALARAVFPELAPDAAIGRVLERAHDQGPPVRIVGVLEDLRLVSLSEASPPLVFLPWGQGARSGEVVGWVRTPERTEALVGPISEAVRGADPSLPAYGMRSGADQVDRLIVEERVVARLALVLGLAGLLLAGVGLHGVLSYAVTERRREIGVRAALGASGKRIVGRFVVHGLVLTGLGLVMGGVGAGLLVPALSSRLFGVQPLDLATWSVGALALLAIAVFAVWGPARRATRVCPTEALRAE